MGHPRDLTQIQRWMQSVITHPDGVTAGLDSDAARTEIDVAAENVEDVICPSQSLTSIERLEVYGNAYYARLLECLRHEFPALCHALGEELFDGFAFGYLQAYPSTSYTLAQLGAHFAAYLEQTRPPRDADADQPDWADLMIDLARLERTYAEVFDGPGAEGRRLLQPGDLADIPQNAWSGLLLVPVESLRLMSFRFAVHEYSSAVRRGDAPAIPEAEPTLLAITRRDFIVRRLPLSPVQFAVLGAIVDGKTLGQAIAIAATSTPSSLDELATSLRSWFEDWSAARFFDRLEQPV